MLTGPHAVKNAFDHLFAQRSEKAITIAAVIMKVSGEGITLTDHERRCITLSHILNLHLSDNYSFLLMIRDVTVHYGSIGTDFVVCCNSNKRRKKRATSQRVVENKLTTRAGSKPSYH